MLAISRRRDRRPSKNLQRLPHKSKPKYCNVKELILTAHTGKLSQSNVLRKWKSGDLKYSVPTSSIQVKCISVNDNSPMPDVGAAAHGHIFWRKSTPGTRVKPTTLSNKVIEPERTMRR
ncbi:MAG: hypothetical protein M3239_06950 [Thermoproteota archaeon]|nr:hypothetical protein [Thermoproteota archaeon]